MRKKDWADKTAENLQDVISEGDDEQLIQTIAVELRKAFLIGLLMEQTGKYVHTTGTHKSTELVMVRKRPSNPDILRALELMAEDEVLPEERATWDGVPGVKSTAAPTKKKTRRA
jgi:hypothetical protein